VFAAFFGVMFGVGAYSWFRKEAWAFGIGLAAVALYDVYVRFRNEDNVGWPLISPGAGARISIVPLWISVIVAVLAFWYIRH
jgi:hypothetical protein